MTNLLGGIRSRRSERYLRWVFSSVLVVALGSVVPASPAHAEETKEPISAAGAVGIGVGVVAAMNSLVTIDEQVSLRIWLQERLALQAQVELFGFIPGEDQGDAGFRIAPGVIFLYSVLKGRTTRFNVGGGIGFSARLRDAQATPAVGDSVDFQLALPLRLGVEHFFEEWISMEIATQTDFLQFRFADDRFQGARIGFDTTSFVANLFFYVD